MDHPSFWWELMGKVGAPIFAGTLVGCVLKSEFAVEHVVLMGMGFVFLAMGHWRAHHRTTA